MRPHHPALLLLAALAACYDGRQDVYFGGAPGDDLETTGDPATTTGDPDDVTSDGSDATGDGDASTTDAAAPGQRLPGCDLCGCNEWTVVLDAPDPPIDVALAATSDGGAVIAAASADALTLHRFDADGAKQWTREFPGSVADVRVVAVGGHVLALAGTLTGALEFAADQPNVNLQSAGGADVFVALYNEGETGDPGGAMWTAAFGDADEQRVSDLAVTGCGEDLAGCRLHLAGVHSGALGLDAAAPVAAPTVYHSQFPALHRPNGGDTWRLDAADAPALAAGPDGSITLIATVRDQDAGDILVRRTDAAGELVWDLRLGGAGEQRVASAVHATDGALWLAGTVLARTDLGTGPFGVDAGETTFLAALDSVGLPRAARALDGWLPAHHALAVTPAAVVVTGYASAALDLGGGLLPFAGVRDVMLAHYGPAADYRCAALYGDANPQEGLAVAARGDRTFVLARVQGSIDFDRAAPTANTTGALVLAAFTR
jgi:hypothetical protein